MSGQAITPWPDRGRLVVEPTLSYSDGATLPPGLSINATTGTITGTPTAAGTYPVAMTVTDAAGYSVAGQLHLDHHQHRLVPAPAAQSERRRARPSPT